MHLRKIDARETQRKDPIEVDRAPPAGNDQVSEPETTDGETAPGPVSKSRSCAMR
jgi:hypothetical protein